jgi:hypothetical protein
VLPQKNEAANLGGLRVNPAEEASVFFLVRFTLVDVAHHFSIGAGHLIGIGDGFVFAPASKGSLRAGQTDRQRG